MVETQKIQLQNKIQFGQTIDPLNWFLIENLFELIFLLTK